jgi:macrolide transport system ATP-binding/permease protein
VPELFTKLKLRLKFLLRRNQLERDLEDEIAFHVAMREEKLRENGAVDPKSAAYRRFGNQTRIKEDLREAWSFAAVERLWADVRIGLRFIQKNRWAMFAVLLSLSLGIGATAAVFSLFDFFVFRSFPVPNTDRVVWIAAHSQASGSGYLVSNPDFEDLRERTASFEGIVSSSPDQIPYVQPRSGQQGRNLIVQLVSANFFSSLRVQPIVGRGFRPEEDEVPDRDAVAVISDNLWRREYGSSPDVIGTSIRINSRDFTIVGVAPSSFYGLDPVARPEVYLPRVMETVFANEASLTDRTAAARRLQIVGRLMGGVSLEQAREEVARIGADLEREHPESNRGQRMTVYTQLGAKMSLSPEAFLAAGIFFLVSGLVLGIACVNVANLLLSTAPARTREMGIRVAMGASRGRLIRQMLIESVLVSIGGALLGLVVAELCAHFIRTVELFSNLPININVAVDKRVAVFASIVAIAAGIASGLIPALRSSRSNLSGLLKSEDTHIAGAAKMRIRRGLVMAQVAIAVVVLALSGFSLVELQLLRNADPGFRVDNVLRVALSPLPHHKTFFRESLERLRVLPGVRGAAVSYPEPFGIGNEFVNLVIDGYTLPPDQSSLPLMSAAVTDGYFDALQIPIVRGRAFDVRDTEENARVIIINEAMAAKYLAGRDPLGVRVKAMGTWLSTQPVTLEIIGIARNAKYRSMSEQSEPFVYQPMKKNWPGYGTLFVVTNGDPASFGNTVRRELDNVDPSPPVYDTGTMSMFIRREALIVERLMAQVMTGVSVVGLMLSVFGLYGVIGYSVSQRSHEIGIRIAVGATRRDVTRLILAEGVKLSLTGIAAGAILSMVLKSLFDVYFRYVNSSGSVSSNALVYASVIILSLAITLLACYMPARRASMVDPNVALRCDN